MKTMDLTYKYLFGPVPSRRLGISLGVDLMPHKTCTLDCIYCECGKTTHLTLKRNPYIPVSEIKRELSAFLSEEPQIDHITFSGSGEPSLHSGMGEIIRFLKSQYPQYKVALLTNGTLLYLPAVVENVLAADIIISSLDAASEKAFNLINRPHPGLNVSLMIDGLIAFRKKFSNIFQIELFIVPGINDTPIELEKIKTATQRIMPDRIQLNTLDRPGTETWVKPADNKTLAEIEKCFESAKTIQYINGKQKAGTLTDDYETIILSTLMRRPCTAQDISQILDISVDTGSTYLERLEKKGAIEKKVMKRGIFYTVLN